MKNKLIDFLPQAISNVKEFKEIMNTETIELELIEDKQKQFLYENFINTATSKGVKHQEKLFKIRADLEKEHLEFRKLRIKNRKLDKAPFTYKFLENKLTSLFGKNSYKLELLNDKYILKVEIHTFDWNMFNEIINNFRRIIPCNILLNSTLTQKINTCIYFGGALTSGETVTVYPWSPKTIESKCKITIPIGNNTGIDTTTIYPKRR
ncbi:DUF2313 domain-containing protein [Clostridium botulinum C/D]|uniref:putative phage tail protein n=1 Tax=Clostridium botulinum TaxID=1491 RepID=UPI001E44C35B|nr:putative phage tail protein [Clostridium botulinum]MCD3211831.1 DUF2313 domain-containing protein [Clostridium botulinum C/D]